MAKGKKTIKVARVLEMANKILAAEDSPYVTDGMRKGIASLLEQILHDTDNYSGFNYLEWLNGGCKRWQEAGRPEDNRAYLGNETKRVYYASKAMRPQFLTADERAATYPKGLQFKG